MIIRFSEGVSSQHQLSIHQQERPSIVDPHLARSEQILLCFTEGGGGDDGVVVVVAADVVVVVNSEPINRV